MPHTHERRSRSVCPPVLDSEYLRMPRILLTERKVENIKKARTENECHEAVPGCLAEILLLTSSNEV